MKIEKYERPDLEELELILEGSFLDDSTSHNPDHPDVPIDPGEGGEDGEDIWN